MSNTAFLPLFALGILCSFLFSGIETGILTMDPILLQRRVRNGSKRAAKLDRLLVRKDLILATLLIGNNLTNVSLSALTTHYLNRHFQAHAPLIAISIVTPAVLIFGEILPKSLFMAHGERLLLSMEPVIFLTASIFRPFAAIAMVFPKILGASRPAGGNLLTREDLRVLVKTGAASRDIGQDERIMISRLLEMKDRRVVKAMKPINDVAMIPDTARIRDAHRMIRKHGVTRLPVFHEHQDAIIGIVLATDLLTSTDPMEPLDRYLRKPFFIPEQKAIFQMLEENLGDKEIAIVIDEYGLATGIITMEDMVEEIMGNILDEYDLETPIAYRLMSGSHVVDSRISIKEFNETIAPVLPTGDYLTLSGFLTSRLQKIPRAGDTFETGSTRFVILDASPQRIGRVMVHIVEGSDLKTEVGDQRFISKK